MTINEFQNKIFLDKNHLSQSFSIEYLENSIIEYLYKYHRIKIERARYEGRFYPELLILDRTRNIFGYISIQHHTAENNILAEKIEFDLSTKKRIQVSYSELDRPVFFIHCFSGKSSIEIYFLTSEQIQDIILRNIEEGNQTPFFPNKDVMGSFVEFINIVKTNIK